MGWKLIQLLTVFAVLGSNIAYRWTENPYLASILAFCAAFVVTAWLSSGLNLWRRHSRQRALTAKHRGH